MKLKLIKATLFFPSNDSQVLWIKPCLQNSPKAVLCLFFQTTFAKFKATFISMHGIYQ